MFAKLQNKIFYYRKCPLCFENNFFLSNSVVDTHHHDTDPDPDSTYHPDADPDVDADSGLIFDADPDMYPDPTIYSDADPDPDPSFQLKAQTFEKVLKLAQNSIHFGLSTADRCGCGSGSGSRSRLSL
jgi:hypothetical protein